MSIADPPNGDPTGLSDVLVGALGLSGALILVGFVLAILLAGGLFWWRSRTGLHVDLDEVRDQHIL